MQFQKTRRKPSGVIYPDITVTIAAGKRCDTLVQTVAGEKCNPTFIRAKRASIRVCDSYKQTQHPVHTGQEI